MVTPDAIVTAFLLGPVWLLYLLVFQFRALTAGSGDAMTLFLVSLLGTAFWIVVLSGMRMMIR